MKWKTKVMVALGVILVFLCNTVFAGTSTSISITDLKKQITSLQKQIQSLNKTITSLKTQIAAKDNSIKDLQGQVSSLTKVPNPEGYIELSTVSNVAASGTTTIILPFETSQNPIYGTSIERNDKVTNIDFETSGRNMIINLDGIVTANSAYNLRIFTKNGKKYMVRLEIPEYQKIILDNGREQLIKVAAKPEKGFNYDYYLWIPKNIDAGQNNYLMVESNNSGGVSDDIKVHEQRVIEHMKRFGLSRYLGELINIPVMMPVFPRPETGWEVYTQDLDRDTVLIRDGRMVRLDLQLIAMIKDSQSLLSYNGIKTQSKIFMTGYSASAKFANKFTILHPEIVKAVATGGVNACTLLPVSEWEGSKLRYPVGIWDFKEITGHDFNESEYRKVAQYIYMGQTDTNDVTQFRDGYDLEDAELTWKVLGKQMMPERWEKMKKIYQDLGYSNSIQFHTYEGIGHEITGNVIDDLVHFFNTNRGDKILRIQPHTSGKDN